MNAIKFAVFDIALMELRDLLKAGFNSPEILDAFHAVERLIPLFELDRSEIPGEEL